MKIISARGFAYYSGYGCNPKHAKLCNVFLIKFQVDMNEC